MNELQGMHVIGRIHTVAGCGALCRWNQLDTFVIANHLGGNAGCVRGLSYIHVDLRSAGASDTCDAAATALVASCSGGRNHRVTGRKPWKTPSPQRRESETAAVPDTGYNMPAAACPDRNRPCLMCAIMV